MRFVSPETELPQGRKLFYKGQGGSFGEHEVLTAVPRTWEKCCDPSLAKCSPRLGVKAIACPEKQWEMLVCTGSWTDIPKPLKPGTSWIAWME